MTVDPARDPDSQRLGLALESAGLGEFEWDFAADTFHVSDRMAAITGLDPGAHAAGEGAGFDSHIHPDDRESFEQERRGHTQSTGPFQMSFRHIRPDDGRVIWLRVAGVISPGPDGRPAKLTGIVEDITAARAEDERRLQSLAEVDHRVKNVLATVQALAQQTARRTTTLDGFLHAFSGRLKAMASANELLTAARWRGAAIDHLAAAELSPLAPGQTTWSGPELFLTPRAANALSMALHELAANAVRHGALSTDTGHVQLTWRTTPAGGFELTWPRPAGRRSRRRNARASARPCWSRSPAASCTATPASSTCPAACARACAPVRRRWLNGPTRGRRSPRHGSPRRWPRPAAPPASAAPGC